MRRVIVLLVLIMIMKGAQAQNFHVTAFLGASNYQGDLQEKRYTFDQAHFAYGAGLMYEITPHFFARANITMGKVSGDDKKASKKDNRDRNLNFTSLIRDIHLGLEYDLFSLYERSLTPYVFVGISAYHFDPYTFDSSGTKFYLQPLTTEGQGFYKGRKKYDLDQIAIPVGAGLKLALNDNLRIGFELGFRKLFTDYLDDVSTTFSIRDQLLAQSGQAAVDLSYREDELKPGMSYPGENGIRGNPKSKDWYYFSGLTVSFRINPGEKKYSSGRSRGRGKYGCPTNVY